ncbi:MAG: hypothetical protein IJ529_03990 [Alphaproteobacteria bacterium]|nr:hypothetical protein [Alphaproteobacteria bacterium]MBR1600227.1 hypothetical protein [Alphaproteobacteria bacterium]
MANNKINFESVKGFFGKVWKFILSGISGLYKLLSGVFMGLVLLALFIVFYNPVMFLFWSIVSPKKAADILYGKPELPVFTELMQLLDGWMVWFYPFWMKKHFMKARGIENYSPKLQAKYFYRIDNSIDCIKNMSAEAVHYLFAKSAKDVKMMIAKSGVKLTEDEISLLIYNHCYETLDEYLKKFTPSAKTLRLLASVANMNDCAKTLLVNCIKKYGLSAEMVTHMFGTLHKDIVVEALKVFAQKRFISRNKNEQDFLTFLDTEESITPEAQVCINTTQYIAFHNRKNTLDDNVVVYFLSQGNVEFCKLIFSFEKDHGLVNDKAKAIVNANPELKSAYLGVIRSQKE